MPDEPKSSVGSVTPQTSSSGPVPLSSAKPLMGTSPASGGLPSNLPIKNIPDVPAGLFGTDIKIKPPVPSSFISTQMPRPSSPPAPHLSAAGAGDLREAQPQKSAGSPISPPPKIPTPPPVFPSPRQDTTPSWPKKELSLSGQAPVTKPSLPPVSAVPMPTPPLTSSTGSPRAGSGQAVFKSSIRTMQEDLAALKKGQQPTGAKLEKQSETDIKMPSESGVKITPPPPKAGPKVELGKLEKARPMFGGIGPTSAEAKKEEKPSLLSIFGLGKAKSSEESTLPPSGVSIKIPEKEGPLGRWSNIAIGIGGKRKVLLIAVGGVAAVTILIFWVFRNVFDTGDVTFSPTPTPSVTASSTIPTLTPLENYFSITESLKIDLGLNFLTNFEALIDTGKLASSKVPALYRLLDSAGAKRHGLRDVMDTLLIQVPANIQNSAADKDFYLTAFYKTDEEIGYSFIVKVNDVNTVKAALVNWEVTMTDGLKDFFQFDDEDAASTVFLDNTHKGVAIRYRNFPTPNLTIDYAIVNALNGSSYLVFANSREHIYSIIDRIK